MLLWLVFVANHSQAIWIGMSARPNINYFGSTAEAIANAMSWVLSETRCEKKRGCAAITIRGMGTFV